MLVVCGTTSSAPMILRPILSLRQTSTALEVVLYFVILLLDVLASLGTALSARSSSLLANTSLVLLSFERWLNRKSDLVIAICFRDAWFLEGKGVESSIEVTMQ